MDGMPLVGFAEHVAKHSHEDAVKGSSGYGGIATGGVENIFQAALPAVAASPAVQKALREGKKNDGIRFSPCHTDRSIARFPFLLLPQPKRTSLSTPRRIRSTYRVSKDMEVIS
jgi:hypothetical protein